MRLNSKFKAACLTGVAMVAALAAGEALAGGRGGGWRMRRSCHRSNHGRPSRRCRPSCERVAFRQWIRPQQGLSRPIWRKWFWRRRLLGRLLWRRRGLLWRRRLWIWRLWRRLRHRRSGGLQRIELSAISGSTKFRPVCPPAVDMSSAPVTTYQASQHIIYLSTTHNARRAGVATAKGH